MGTRPFHCQQFTIHQDRCAMKVGTDSLLLGSWVCTSEEQKILDIGSGSGLLALMMAQRTPFAEVVGVEIDEEAAEQARENVAASPWGDRVRIEIGAIQDRFLHYPDELFDLIVCNPPFFVQGNGVSSPKRARQTARHTIDLPHDTLLSIGRHLLADNGRFALILPNTMKTSFLACGARVGLYPQRLARVRPFAHKEPNRFVVELVVGKRPCLAEEIVIRETPQQYTVQYRALTADFYL